MQCAVYSVSANDNPNDNHDNDDDDHQNESIDMYSVQCQLTWSTDMSSIEICIHVCLQFKFAAPIDMYSVQCACVQLCSVCINVCINVPSIEVCRRQAQYVVHRPGSVASICAFHLLTYNTTQMITITHHKIFLSINNFRKKKIPQDDRPATATAKRSTEAS